jgi:hypothetical protein
MLVYKSTFGEVFRLRTILKGGEKHAGSRQSFRRCNYANATRDFHFYGHSVLWTQAATG